MRRMMRRMKSYLPTRTASAQVLPSPQRFPPRHRTSLETEALLPRPLELLEAGHTRIRRLGGLHLSNVTSLTPRFSGTWRWAGSGRALCSGPMRPSERG